MKKYIVANWKMHPDSWAEAEGILDAVSQYLESVPEKDNSLVVCPPFVFLEEVGKLLNTTSLGGRVELGAQDIALTESTALTGEISGAMLQKLGVRHVIVGHSERRWKLGESDIVVNQKIETALEHELTPIVCVGEKERDDHYKEFLASQLDATFGGLSADQVSKCLIAYEPVWAISTNPNTRPDNPESTLESVRIIKDFIIGKWKLENGNSLKVLYGGSVTSKNANDFLSLDELAGVLVGGASVDKEQFIEILKQI